MPTDAKRIKFPGEGHKLGGMDGIVTSPPQGRRISYDENDMLILDEGEKKVFEWAVAVDVLPRLFRSSVPIMVSLFFSISALNLILFMFAGTYVDGSASSTSTSGESVVFAGVSLCTMFTNVSFLSILIGLASAVETLGSQNNGAGNYAETGYTLQRSVLILSCVAVPVIFIWLNAEHIFGAIGVAPDVCVVIRVFMQVCSLVIYS